MHTIMHLFCSLSKAFLGLIFLIKTTESMAPYQLNMYNTDEQIYTDVDGSYCIYYYTYFILDSEYYPQHHLYTYCIRSSRYLKVGSIGIQSFMTFNELRQKNIASYDLVSWSAPIDIIERYEMYLKNISTGNDSQRFYNCTWPLFGPVCQFRFSIQHNLLPHLIQNSMRLPFPSDKSIESEILNSHTCYVNLACNYIYQKPMCLTWRDICDGKVHCLNNEIDEKDCFQLELNQCDETTEYRCHNGQCIPIEFFRDISLYPDCLDQSDEFIDYSETCYLHPSMRCDDHICRPDPSLIHCQDGECHEIDCRNGQIERWTLALTITSTISLPFAPTCWNAINCLARFDISPSNDRCFYSNEWYSNARIVQNDCPFIFPYPIYPVALGHIYFVYQKNQSFLHGEHQFAAPAYICYNAKFCPIFSSLSYSSLFPRTIFLSINSTNNSSCHLYDSLLNLKAKKIISWYRLQKIIEEFYSKFCLKPSQITEQHLNITSEFHSLRLYLCQNSTKYISKSRLLDGFFDCPLNDDEFYENSCSLTTIHRQYQCLINKTIACISPQLFFGEKNPCQEHDKPSSNTFISFQTLCDGFTDHHSSLTNNDKIVETDETDCDYNIWPCDNIYTHCDHIWNCPNGIDELNCSYLFHTSPDEEICSPMQHICISPTDLSIRCLDVSQINDNVVDCFGATDERHLCRQTNPDPSYRYRCPNDYQCLPSRALCSKRFICAAPDKLPLCETIDKFHPAYDYHDYFQCKPPYINKQSLIVKILCYLDESEKRTEIFFSLKNSPIYPKTLSISQTKRINTRQSMSNPFEIDQIDEAGFGPFYRPCNRGLPIQIRYGQNLSFTEECLCPSGYYGSRCQYENQRVVLTVQFRVEYEWRTMFSFIFLLMDNDEQIHSYEKLAYLSTRDCRAKFHIYLLYKIRPKNVTKQYFIRIHGYTTNNLQYRTSWLYPIIFSFLPVYRLSIQLKIPSQRKSSICLLDCGQHGDCIEYENNSTQFCHCHSGWKGKHCEVAYKCLCAKGSLCIQSSNICVCSLNRYGPRCYIEQTICQKKSTDASIACLNDGICIPHDSRFTIKQENFSCICPANTWGDRCQYMKSEIELLFDRDISMPIGSLYSYFISVQDQFNPEMNSILSKIDFHQTNIILYIINKFEIILIQFENDYYLIYLQLEFKSFSQMKIPIDSSQRCLHINQLFNQTVLNYHLLRRVKFYHLACREHLNLRCFYDLEQFMCLCTTNHHANCFHFNFTSIYDCQGNNYCLNNGLCFQDKFPCPTASVCSCTDCFYGSLCQFSSDYFSLSLESILGYHIKSNTSLFHQSNTVKISLAIVILMFTIGFIGGLCTMIIFILTPIFRTIGCGIYILTLSIINIFVLVGFLIKFFLLLFIQNGTISNQWIIKHNCIFMDFIIRILLNIVEWLYACVSIERTLAVIMGLSFNKDKSVKVIFFLFVVNLNFSLYIIYVDIKMDYYDSHIILFFNSTSRSI